MVIGLEKLLVVESTLRRVKDIMYGVRYAGNNSETGIPSKRE